MRQDRLFGSGQSKSSRFLAVLFWVLQLKRLHNLKGVAHCGYLMIAELIVVSQLCHNMTVDGDVSTIIPLVFIRRWCRLSSNVVGDDFCISILACVVVDWIVVRGKRGLKFQKHGCPRSNNTIEYPLGTNADRRGNNTKLSR